MAKRKMNKCCADLIQTLALLILIGVGIDLYFIIRNMMNQEGGLQLEKMLDLFLAVDAGTILTTVVGFFICCCGHRRTACFIYALVFPAVGVFNLATEYNRTGAFTTVNIVLSGFELFTAACSYVGACCCLEEEVYLPPVIYNSQQPQIVIVNNNNNNNNNNLVSNSSNDKEIINSDPNRRSIAPPSYPGL